MGIPMGIPVGIMQVYTVGIRITGTRMDTITGIRTTTAITATMVDMRRVVEPPWRLKNHSKEPAHVRWKALVYVGDDVG